MKSFQLTSAEIGAAMKSAAGYAAVAVAVLILAAELTYTAGAKTGHFVYWLNDQLSGIASGRIAWRPIVAATVEWAHLILSAPVPAAQPAPHSPTVQRLAAVPVRLPTAPTIQRPPLEALTVRQLRTLAREAGFSALARSGRRADLLAALSQNEI